MSTISWVLLATFKIQKNYNIIVRLAVYNSIYGEIALTLIVILMISVTLIMLDHCIIIN
jgi:hypothetical protein